MRLYFQIMCFLIITSVKQIELVLALRSKRLLPYDFRGYSSGRGRGYGSESINQPSCADDDNPTKQRVQFLRKTNRISNAKSHATGIAVQAAQEARQANEDMAGAVKLASDKIKLEYAERARAAAMAAEAVLAGKHQVLEQLEMEVREAEAVLQDESQELSSAEANCQLARKAHQQSQEALQLLITGVKLAKENYESSEQVSCACQSTLTDKSNLLETAQKRVAALLRQLSEARNDYTKTKKAAYRAMCAANEAKQRITRTKR